MAYCRQTLLILFALVFGAGQLGAASRMEKAYTSAVAAFNDGIYDRAEAELTRFIEDYKNSGYVAEAILLNGQAQYKQGKFTEAIATLSAPEGDWGKLADQYAYWQAESKFARGDFEGAASTFTNLAARFPDSPLCLTAVVEAAAAYERLGDWPQLTGLLSATNGVFGKMAAQDSANELVARGRLLLARAEFIQNEFTAARVTLSLLDARALSPDLDWQRSSLLCQVELGANNLSAALAESTNLMAEARQQKDAAPQRLAESLALRATILERMRLWPEAAADWQQNITNSTTPANWRQQAILKLADNAVAQNNLTNAMSRLVAFLAQFTNSPATDLAVLTLGELNLRAFVASPAETNYAATALAAFNQLLATNAAATDLAGKAYLDRGWYYWLAATNADPVLTGQNLTNSLQDFRSAAQRLPLSEDLAVAKFKVGDVLFALQDYSGARESYQSVMKEFANWPRVMESLGDRALYQVVRTSVKLGDKTAAEQAMKQLIDRFPASELGDNAELLLGEGLSEMNSSTNAIATFNDFAQRFPDSPLRPQAELDVAKTYERSGDWASAIASYQNWLTAFPTNDLRPQAEYALGWAEFKAGNETNALAQFTGFVTNFPADPLAPLAQWWVADYYFRLSGTNYAEAEKDYEYLFQNTNAVWRSSALFYPAQLMAGRAAAGRLGFQDAAKYFSDAANSLTQLMGETNRTPQLESLATQALFAYGSVLMRWDSPDTNRPFLNFEKAADVFASLAQKYPTNELGALALSELGDCNLQIGAFDAATNAYGQVVNSPFASAGLRSRAQVGLGRVLEKMAEAAAPAQRDSLLKAALNDYLDVLFENNLREGETADAFWTKKAGLSVLPLMTTLKIGNVDKTIDRLEQLLPQLTEMLEKKRAALQN
jgi:TolA-binding protein